MRVLFELKFIRTLLIIMASIPSCYGGMGHGMMGGGMGFGMILVTLFWVAIIVLIIVLIVWLLRRGKS